jgi:cupin fold WbuC family metalloprotein
MNTTTDRSFVSLHDEATCWRDTKAKSIGYFSKGTAVRLDASTVDEIRAMALETGDNVRLSLHGSPESNFHEMIIFQHRNKYYRPKKHVTKAKSFHMIEGEMAVFVFDDSGALIDAHVLDGKKSIIYRVAANVFHTDVPLTDYVIHHESTLGPFMGDEDRIFAPWSPSGDDPEAYLRYRDELIAALD